jgi:multiple sugar transport system substrate-binding protein
MSEEKKEEKGISRRKYLGTVGGLAAATAIGWGVTGYLATRRPAPAVERTVTITKTVTATPVITTPATPTPTEIVVKGATPKERALNAARQYVEINNIPPGTKLRCLAPPGAKSHYDKKYVKEFEDACLGRVEIEPVTVPPEEIYTKYMTEAVEKSGAYDHISVVPASYLADVVEAGLAMDCTEFMKKYDPELDHGPCPYPEAALKGLMYYKDRFYGFNYDYDVWLNHYRKDLFENPDEQKAFESEFGYPLRPPRTWKEFLDVSKFFYRPDEGLYPTWEYKVLYWELFNFKLRFLTKGKYFFDKEMHPNIDREEGIEALKEELEASQYQPPESWTSYWDVNYPWYVEEKPKLAFLISWTSLMKFCRAKGMVHKVGLAFTPGTPMANGEIRIVGFEAASHIICVNKYSKYPELAYLFNQYMADPEISTKVMKDPSGYYEEHRSCHFKDPDLVKDYGEDNLKIEIENYDYFAPDITIPGVREYDDALDRNLNAVFKKVKDPVKALRDTHDAWEEITDRLGREKQIEAWLHLVEGFGPKLKPYMSF